MKANKALKRLGKIAALLGSVVKRNSTISPELSGALKEAKAALGRAKEAVSSDLRKPAKPKRKPTGKRDLKKDRPRPQTVKGLATVKKTAPRGKKSAVKKVAARAARVKSKKKRSRVKQAALTATPPDLRETDSTP